MRRDQATVLHGGIRGGQIVRRSVRRARMDAHRGVQVGVGRAQDHAHGRARRQPGDEDPARIDVIGGHDLAGEAGQERGLVRGF
jgi:hypothetical protein